MYWVWEFRQILAIHLVPIVQRSSGSLFAICMVLLYNHTQKKIFRNTYLLLNIHGKILSHCYQVDMDEMHHKRRKWTFQSLSGIRQKQNLWIRFFSSDEGGGTRPEIGSAGSEIDSAGSEIDSAGSETDSAGWNRLCSVESILQGRKSILQGRNRFCRVEFIQLDRKSILQGRNRFCRVGFIQLERKSILQGDIDSAGSKIDSAVSEIDSEVSEIDSAGSEIDSAGWEIDYWLCVCLSCGPELLAGVVADGHVAHHAQHDQAGGLESLDTWHWIDPSN